jgi:hypothetical protein
LRVFNAFDFIVTDKISISVYLLMGLSEKYKVIVISNSPNPIEILIRTRFISWKIFERTSRVFTFSGATAKNVLFSINKITIDEVVW